jgi:hypothetical protein
MIGILLQLLGIGGGDSCFGIILGVVVASPAFCGLYRCSKFRCRDCYCCKRFMRVTGTDAFDDFEITVVVHEALFTASKLKLCTKVRIKAGAHVVQTDESSHGIFQQPLQIFVEQGTETVDVELMDSREKKVLAVKKLNVQKDVLNREGKDKLQDVLYSMKQKSKGLLNPKIRLTVLFEGDSAAEQGLLKQMDCSQESNLVLRQVQQMAEDTCDLQHSMIDENGEIKAVPMSEVELLVRGCAGPVDKFGSWGSRSTVYVAVQGPPDVKKFALGIWRSQGDFASGAKPDMEVELLKVLSVQPDPHPRRSEVFVIQYVDPADKLKKRLTLKRIDRSRDVWVEILTKLIKLLHEEKDARKRVKV